MPNQAVNHYRRTLLKGLGAATLLSPSPAFQALRLPQGGYMLMVYHFSPMT